MNNKQKKINKLKKPKKKLLKIIKIKMKYLRQELFILK